MEDESVGDPFDNDIGDFDGKIVAYEAVDVFWYFIETSSTFWRDENENAQRLTEIIANPSF